MSARRTGSDLTRERIADVALELLDAQGPEALSMRRLAERLGVGTMTLYSYVRDKDDLLDAAMEAITARYPLPANVPGTWREQLRALALRFADALYEHPGVVQLRLARPILTPGALRFTEAGLLTLRDAGFTADQAATGFRTLFIYTFGMAAFSPARRADEARQAAATVLSQLPLEDFPTIRAMIPQVVATTDPRDQYEQGLERILDGLQTQLNASSRRPDAADP